jgi:sugar/nucleoside kinase (ribokinase family)
MTDLDLFAIGSWTIFDHIFKLSAYPSPGDTVTLNMPVERLDATYYGECSANVAAVAAKLGLKSGLGMVVGDDFVKSGYQPHLLELGVYLAGVEIIQDRRSGHSYLYFDANGDGFCISHLGIAENQASWQVPKAIITSARTVVINESFSPYTLAAIKLAKDAGALTAINGMVGTAGDQAQAYLEQTDILFISESELAMLLSDLGIDDIAGLQSLGPKKVFTTLGARGSRVYVGDTIIDVTAVPAAQVVDPTGAGDAYVAGTLTGLLKGLPVRQAARVGATVSSFVVEKWGCQTNLPAWHAVQQRYEQFFQEELAQCK